MQLKDDLATSDSLKKTPIVPAKLSADEKLLAWAFGLFANEGLVLRVFEVIFGFIGVSGAQIAAIAFIYLPVLLVLVSRLQLRKRAGIAGFIVVLVLVGMLFALSYFAHPEYALVMFDDSWPYNIWRRVFGPLSAIWAFLFIMMLGRVEAIFAALRWFAYLGFAYGSYLFIGAMQSGYWEGTSISGIAVRREYSLEFGYDMMAAVTVLIVLAFKGERRLFNTLLAAFGFAMIVRAGYLSASV